MQRHSERAILVLCIAFAPVVVAFAAEPASLPVRYDLVIEGGRVIDPASGLDAVRNVGISGGSIRAVSEDRLDAPTKFDASGMIVAPGFIDLHSHGQTEENYRYKAMDGVTTALELEIGTPDVDDWYAQREKKSLINYGVSAGHIGARMRVLGGPVSWLPEGGAAHNEATDSQINQIRRHVEAGLQRGAVAVGLGIQYTPGASRSEILEMFRAAAKYEAACHVHIRHAGEKEPQSGMAALEEVVAAAAITGAPLHVVHVSSMGLRGTPRLLEAIAEARSRGLEITTECYPYTASMSAIRSAIFDEGWQDALGVSYGDLQWVATGERLTAETFASYRAVGGYVIIHSMPEPMVRETVANPLTIIASDGRLDNGKGHPRSSGTYARVLGRYVREQHVLSWMGAIRKMTIMPAQRLEHRVPMMKNKGRLNIGADADLVVFDPQTVIDQSTFDQPAKYSTGFRLVLVDGTAVVKDGQLQNAVTPGRAIRAPLP
ncbi:MAG TPA: amidohydrolase family protein [Pirellulales bacterium]|nr:amidohydrolase family protein [Pirellulales bacterium]